MAPTRIVAVALLVVAAGCTGLGSPGDATTSPTTDPESMPTTELTTERTETTDAGDGDTTEPHTGVGTSHIGDHFDVRAGAGVENVTVTLSPGGDEATFAVDPGDEVSLTREIHDRGHVVTVVVERGDETVFEETVRGYEYYEVRVHENDTSVENAVV